MMPTSRTAETETETDRVSMRAGAGSAPSADLLRSWWPEVVEQEAGAAMAAIGAERRDVSVE